MLKRQRKTIAAAVALAFALAPLAVRSQQADEKKKPEDEKRHLETINVSAEKVTGFRARTSQVGAVTLVTKRAGPTPVSSLTVSGNEFGGYQGHVDIGRQFDNGLYGMRLNAATGETRNAIDDFKGRRQLVSGAFDVRPNDSLTVKFDFEDIQKAVVEQASVSVPAAVNGVIPLPRVP